MVSDLALAQGKDSMVPLDVGPNPFISTKEVQSNPWNALSKRRTTTQVDVETDPFISPKMFTTPNQGNPHVMPPTKKKWLVLVTFSVTPVPQGTARIFRRRPLLWPVYIEPTLDEYRMYSLYSAQNIG